MGNRLGKNVSIKSYCMLVDARATAFINSESLRENQQVEEVKNTPTLIRVKKPHPYVILKTSQSYELSKIIYSIRVTLERKLVLRIAVLKCMVSTSFGFHTNFKLVLQEHDLFNES